MRLIVATVAVILISGCGAAPNRAQNTADTAQADARGALAQNEELSARVDDLEAELADLTEKHNGLNEIVRVYRVDDIDYRADSVQWHHKHQ